jgi:membrane protease YdiL (CAAX protease family)
MRERSDPISGRRSGDLIAPVWHTVLLVSIFLGLTIGGALFQRNAQSASGVLQEHPNVVPLYVSVIAVEWFLVYGVWAGVRSRGVRLVDLIGGRWHSTKNVVIDIVLAFVVWILWIGVQAGVSRMVPSHAKSVSVLLPQSLLEVVLWIATSLSAGFCEEVAFRGYFQKQFVAMTKSSVAGVILQAILFGISHGYQGLRAVIMISLFGLLYGIVASWRKSLRPGMILHAWSDIYAGYLFSVFALLIVS